MTAVPDSDSNDKITKSLDLEQKVELLLEQHQATQKAIARLRADIPEIIKECIDSVLNRRAIQGYSRISAS